MASDHGTSRRGTVPVGERVSWVVWLLDNEHRL